MDVFHSLYEQYSLVKEKLLENDMVFETNLLQYGITEGYYKKVDQATELLYKFYSSKLSGSDIRVLTGTVPVSSREFQKYAMCLAKRT